MARANDEHYVESDAMDRDNAEVVRMGHTQKTGGENNNEHQSHETRINYALNKPSAQRCKMRATMNFEDGSGKHII